MELRTTLMIAIFVGIFVTTHFVSKLYDQMRQPRRPKGKKKPLGELVRMDVQEDRHLNRQLVNRRNTIIEETDYTIRHVDQP